jgi:hypothetical protein
MVTYESDYPHQDTTWPHTLEYAKQQFAGFSPTDIDAIIRGNAIRMLGLPDDIHSGLTAK